MEAYMTVIPVLIGGLANTLFQIGTCISYSLKHGCDYAIPMKIQNPHYKFQQVFYSKKLIYRWVDDEHKGTTTTYYETQFHYKPIPKMECDWLILNGYFQSRLFFDEYRKEILEILDIPYSMEEGKVAIHVRRGDYLLFPNCHPVVSLEYIHDGIEYFRNIGYKNFIIFSDDIDYCYANIAQPYDCNFEFSEGRTEIEDLILASSCEHCVGSNSAFSWFIYWLNKNEDKIGVFPKKNKWFGEALPHNVDDLYFPEWVLL